MNNPIIAIPDIHGMSGLLNDLLDKIYTKFDGGRIVYTGDYINRGPDSIGVCRKVMEPPPNGWTNHCLIGNHEWMFLNDHKGGPLSIDDYYDPNAAAQLIGEPDVIKWMESLYFVYTWRQHYAFVHGWMDHRCSVQDQTIHHLICRRFAQGEPYLGDMMLIHGHTIVDEPDCAPNRVNLDCGAFRTGRLVAGVFDPERPRLIETIEATQ